MSRIAGWLSVAPLLVVALGCGSVSQPAEDAGRDAAVARDAGTDAFVGLDAMAPIDAPMIDAAVPVDAPASDAHTVDAGVPTDGPVVDSGRCAVGETYCTSMSACRSLSDDPMNCGACGRVCPSGPGAVATCVARICHLGCELGFEDCDGMATNGCEINLTNDVAHCGSCTMSCPTPPGSTRTCVDRACGSSCMTGFMDCDSMASTGCEANLQTDRANCGTCGMTCSTGESCSGGHCMMSYLSCLALHTAMPALPSGAYLLDTDGTGPSAPVTTWCDMVTDGGGWTLVAASASGTNMPRFDTATGTGCGSASPATPCFIGAANLTALTYTAYAWSTGPTAVNTSAPVDNMLAGAPMMQATYCAIATSTCSASCVNATEYYRFNQDDGTQGMGWTGCTPNETYSSSSFCTSSLRPMWNLLSCTGLPIAPGTRSSPDYNCSPFGQLHPFTATDVCLDFKNVRHWRR